MQSENTKNTIQPILKNFWAGRQLNEERLR